MTVPAGMGERAAKMRTSRCARCTSDETHRDRRSKKEEHMRRMILGLCLSLAAVLALASTALAAHLPAYSVPDKSCNQGTERAYDNVNPAAYGYIPIDEGSAAGCHHHHP